MPKKVGYQNYQDNGAADVNVASRAGGENQLLDLQETSGPGTYVNGNAVTSGADINLGSPGAAGNKLYGIGIFNNGAGAPITAVTLWDGSTQLTFLSLAALQVADGSYGEWVPRLGGVMESKNGGWRMRITSVGTMANIRWGAVVAE